MVNCPEREKNAKIVENHKVNSDGEKIFLNKHSQNGHKGHGPQPASLVQTKENVTVNIESNMQSLRVSETLCKKCQEVFDNEIYLQRHVKTKHSTQWN